MARTGSFQGVSLETYSKVVESIYDWALDPNHWHETFGMIAGQRQDLGGRFSATAAIFVQDSVVVPPLPGEAFAKLYGLTGSELRVLMAMVPGLSVKEAAEVLGIGDTTTKTHLQHIYAKTGTAKQTELMHLFMSFAPPVRAAQ